MEYLILYVTPEVEVSLFYRLAQLAHRRKKRVGDMIRDILYYALYDRTPKAGWKRCDDMVYRCDNKYRRHIKITVNNVMYNDYIKKHNDISINDVLSGYLYRRR